MVANQSNLKKAISFWLNSKSNWPSDFHNQLYYDLAEMRGDRLTEKFWEDLVHILWEWRAIRPLTKQAIRDESLKVIKSLNEEYQIIRKHQEEEELSLGSIDWELLEPLFTLAFNIKGVNSPVFASKTCHFLIPELFPVVDREVVGINSDQYSEFWAYCVKLWKECSEKDELIDTLKEAIKESQSNTLFESDSRIIESYPWPTKIVELCIIGNRL